MLVSVKDTNTSKGGYLPFVPFSRRPAREADRRDPAGMRRVDSFSPSGGGGSGGEGQRSRVGVDIFQVTLSLNRLAADLTKQSRAPDKVKQ